MYLVTPGSKDFVLCMATPEGFVTPPDMVLQVLGNLYGLPSSDKNFSEAVDVIILKLGYKNTPYDPMFFCKWIDGMPILVMYHRPSNMLSEWDALVKAFKGSRNKVKDCTNEPSVGITVTFDYYYYD